MDEKLIKLFTGLQCKWSSFMEDLKKDESGAAEIVAIIVIIVVILAVAVIFRERLMGLVNSVFDKTEDFTTNCKLFY